MKALPLLSLLFASSLFAQNQISFKAGETYRMEGTLEGKYFVINMETSNEQRIRLISRKKMVDGAQYAACIEFLKDCHLECSGKIKGTPVFITPNIEPKLLIPDSEGAYEKADKSLCP